MPLQIKTGLNQTELNTKDYSQYNPQIFSKDYVEFLNEAGWRLERKLPSNRNQYSDLLEDTDWKSNISDLNLTKHYRRDLDALS
tara:strand:+ start:307 stop:558 length:252 start_codon:yes stop_codon:yes gene_type:complete